MLLDASPQPGAPRRLSAAERRYDAVVLTLQWLLRIYVIACVAHFFWKGPGPRWNGINVERDDLMLLDVSDVGHVQDEAAG